MEDNGSTSEVTAIDKDYQWVGIGARLGTSKEVISGEWVNGEVMAIGYMPVALGRKPWDAGAAEMEQRCAAKVGEMFAAMEATIDGRIEEANPRYTPPRTRR